MKAETQNAQPDLCEIIGECENLSIFALFTLID